MVKGPNLQIAEYKASIIAAVNQSDMPSAITVEILSNILNNVIKANNKIVEIEKAEYIKSIAQPEKGE